MQKILLLFFVIVAKCCNASSNCYSVNKHVPFVHHFAAQTPYFPDNDVTKFNIHGCTPTKIWIIVRHGTCHPPDDIAASYNYLAKMRDEIKKTDGLCQKDYDLIKNWKLITSGFIPHDLTMPQGWDDQRDLAKRWRRRYPNIFVKNFSPDLYKFGHTSTIRTVHSCQAFTQGLFGENENYSKIKPITNDILLSPFMNCTAYMQNFNQIKNSIPITSFESSSEFQQVYEAVKNRLGLDNTNFKTKDLIALFNQCTYDQAANLEKLSPWCSVFNLDEMKVLEYLFDLENYYKASYGYQSMTEKLPCAAIKDLYDSMKDSTDNTKVTAYFTHSYMLEMMLTALGTYHDKLPLLGTNFYQQTNRKFKTNKFLPFAANLAAVKYECSNNQPAQILFMWNEKPIVMPWCVGGSICTLDEIHAMYYNSTMSNCPCDICGKEFAENSMKGLPPFLFSMQDAKCLDESSLSSLSTLSSISDEIGSSSKKSKQLVPGYS